MNAHQHNKIDHILIVIHNWGLIGTSILAGQKQGKYIIASENTDYEWILLSHLA